MHLQLKLSSMNESLIVLPIHYNSVVQDLIYSTVQDEMPQLHDDGFEVGGGAEPFAFLLFPGSMVRLNILKMGK